MISWKKKYVSTDEKVLDLRDCASWPAPYCFVKKRHQEHMNHEPQRLCMVDTCMYLLNYMYSIERFVATREVRKHGPDPRRVTLSLELRGASCCVP